MKNSNQQLTKQERRELRQQKKEQMMTRGRRKRAYRRIALWTIIFLGVGGVIGHNETRSIASRQWRACFCRGYCRERLDKRGEVLSRDTGAIRAYGRYPYAGGDYFGVDGLSLQLVNPKDTRLPNDAFAFGITVNGKTKAYHTEAVKRKGAVTDEFAGKTFILRHDRKLDVIRMFRKLPDGNEERINPISGFLFSWSAVHPNTELYK